MQPFMLHTPDTHLQAAGRGQGRTSVGSRVSCAQVQAHRHASRNTHASMKPTQAVLHGPAGMQRHDSSAGPNRMRTSLPCQRWGSRCRCSTRSTHGPCPCSGGLQGNVACVSTPLRVASLRCCRPIRSKGFRWWAIPVATSTAAAPWPARQALLTDDGRLAILEDAEVSANAAVSQPCAHAACARVRAALGVGIKAHIAALGCSA